MRVVNKEERAIWSVLLLHFLFKQTISWLFIAKWAIFGPCELAIFGKNIGYSQLFGLFLGRVWLFRLFYNMLAIFRLWELAILVSVGQSQGVIEYKGQSFILYN